MIARVIVKLIEKVKRAFYRLYFSGKVGMYPEGLNILGKINIFNTNVEIGRNVTLYPGVSFYGDGRIVIGDNVKIGHNTIIHASCNGGVSIGQDTVIAAQTYIIDTNHRYEKDCLIREAGSDTQPVVIEDDVWIAANVSVIKGARIGTGAVIGAKALVNKEIEEYSVYAGIPARKIGCRN